MALSDGLGENSVVRSANIETQTETRFFLEVDDVEDSLAFVDGEGNEVDEFGMELQTPALASITTNVRSSPSFLMRKAQSSAVSRWGKKNNLPYEMYPSTHDVESGHNPGAGTGAGAGVGLGDENSEAKTGGESGDDVPPPPPGSPGLPRGRQLGRSKHTYASLRSSRSPTRSTAERLSRWGASPQHSPPTRPHVRFSRSPPRERMGGSPGSAHSPSETAEEEDTHIQATRKGSLSKFIGILAEFINDNV